MDKVRPFLASLRSYLASSKPTYGQMLRDSKALTPEVETILKDAIVEHREAFMAA